MHIVLASSLDFQTSSPFCNSILPFRPIKAVLHVITWPHTRTKILKYSKGARLNSDIIVHSRAGLFTLYSCRSVLKVSVSLCRRHVDLLWKSVSPISQRNYNRMMMPRLSPIPPLGHRLSGRIPNVKRITHWWTNV